MSFDFNQFNDDDDCVAYDIEAQWEEALKQFDTSTFDFEEEKEEEELEEEQTNINMDESCVDDGGIQNTVQRKMSFDFTQFDAADDSFDFEVNVVEDAEEQHDDKEDEKEEENNRRCNALAKEIVRIGKINRALDDHLTVLNILKKTKNINDKRKSSTLTRIQKNTIRLDGLLLNGHENNNSNNDTNIPKLLTNEDNSTSLSQNTTTPTKVKVVSNNPSPSSLYEQHKELLRQRYSVPSPSSPSSSFSSSTSTSVFSSESSSLLSSSSTLIVKDKEDNNDDCFSLRLQNAIRTSSSFVHLQQGKNISTAFAA